MPRIAHISDLHFAHLCLSPAQFFSKRWVGNGNLLLARRKEFSTELLKKLGSLLEEQRVDWIFVTGDLSTTGQEKEFLKAQQFFSQLGKKTLFIPGNHDHYTKKDYKRKLFYQFFTNPSFKAGGTSFEKYQLKTDRMELRPLFGNWWYLALDTVLATSIFSSRGLFPEELEKKLRETLQNFPKDQKILFLNHFPFFQFDNPRKTLLRGMALCDVLEKSPQVLFYLHGHTHRHCVADLRCAKLPIILDSGSACLKARASFNLLDLEDKTCNLTVYRYKEENWKAQETQSFAF
jgi:3',5'-cyclic AMP phosphodiesterase CpdA